MPNKPASQPAQRIQTRQMLFMGDLYKEITKGMEAGRSVTTYVLGEPGQSGTMEFEVRVTKLGTTRVPRV